MKGLAARLRGRALDAGLALSVAVLLGRLSGLVRELQLATSFGVSRQADIAVLLLTLPDMLVGLLLAGGLSAALVPRFRQLPPPAAAMLFRRVAGRATIAFAAAGLILALAPDAFLALLAPGIDSPSRVTGALAPALVALALPLGAASGVVAAYLNANDRYFVAGLGTLVFNLSVIAALALGTRAPDQMFLMLAIGVAIGAGARLALQAVVVPAPGWRDRADTVPADPLLARAFAAGIAAVGLTVLAPVLVRAAASLLPGGAVASFNYAQKLTELPVGILITTISTVALTAFSGLIASGDEAGLTTAVRTRVRRSLAIALIVVAFGVAFADPLVTLLFDRGAMDAAALNRVAALTQVSLLQIPFVSVSSLAAAYLNARMRTGEVLRLTGYCLAALPVLAAPGVLLESDRVLMGAVVGFQALVAVALARRARFRLWGTTGFVDARLCLGAVAVGVLSAVLAGLAAALSLPAWLALGIGGVGFAAAMLGAGLIIT